MIASRLGRDGHFFESARWHGGLWWVVDVFDDRIVALGQEGGIEEEYVLPDHLGGLGWLPDGDLLAVLMRRREIVRLTADGKHEVYAELGSLMRGPANDMVVAPDGRVWVGGLGFDMEAGERPAKSPLLTVTVDGAVEVAAEGLAVPNGATILGEGRTLVVAETFGARLTAFPIGADGTLGRGEVWAQLAPEPPLDDLRSALKGLRRAPDGIAADAADLIWCAEAAGGECIRVARGGQVVDRAAVPPGLRPFACALGGPDGATLLICCAPDSVEAKRLTARDSVLVTCRVAVGAP